VTSLVEVRETVITAAVVVVVIRLERYSECRYFPGPFIEKVDF
jgi:hypothetical protein